MIIYARLLAWIVVGVITFATLAPIGLRPVVAQSADLERVLAYALLGLLFVAAYPRHRLAALVCVVALAGFLEYGQALTQTRHGRTDDFLVKALAAASGCALGSVGTGILAWRARRMA